MAINPVADAKPKRASSASTKSPFVSPKRTFAPRLISYATDNDPAIKSSRPLCAPTFGRMSFHDCATAIRSRASQTGLGHCPLAAEPRLRFPSKQVLGTV